MKLNNAIKLYDIEILAKVYIEYNYYISHVSYLIFILHYLFVQVMKERKLCIHVT